MAVERPWVELRERCSRLLGFEVPSHTDIVQPINALLDRLERAQTPLSPADEGDLQSALHAAATGVPQPPFMDWPTAAAILADEVQRLRGNSP